MGKLALIRTIFKKELVSLLISPKASVFVAVFLMVNGVMTFYVGGFFERGIADLEVFFIWHPYIYAFFAPAISMGMWVEERQIGTFEVLTTLPVATWKFVLAKFLSSWLILGFSLLLSMPMWLFVSILGDPDHGVIISGYLGSFILGGTYLAVGSFVSSVSSDQVTAFVGTMVITSFFILSGLPVVVDFLALWLPSSLVYVISNLSFQQIFTEMIQGVIDFSAALYSFSFITMWLFLTNCAVEIKGRSAKWAV